MPGSLPLGLGGRRFKSCLLDHELPTNCNWRSSKQVATGANFRPDFRPRWPDGRGRERSCRAEPEPARAPKDAKRSRLFSDRTGRPVGDYQLRVTTAAFTAAQLEAARCWADADGAESLGRLMDEAVTLIEPIIAAP